MRSTTKILTPPTMESKFVFTAENNPSMKQTAYGGCDIVRMAPVDQTLTIDYRLSAAASLICATVTCLEDSGQEVVQQEQPAAATGCITLAPLVNHKEYQVVLKAYAIQEDQNRREIAASAPRLFRCGHVPGVVVNYIHPEDYTFNSSGRSPASPSIIKLVDGTLLASHDIFWGQGGQNITHVFRSEDGGASWQFASQVTPCFWGTLFTHKEAVYIMGTSFEYGALNLFRSEDQGCTWSKPAQLLPPGSREKGGPHKAPMPVLEHAGRLWTGIDFGSWTLGGHASGAVSAPVNTDLMEPKNWTCTGFLAQHEDWEGVPEGSPRGTLEGNLVAAPDGELYNILRYQHENCVPSFGKAVALHIDHRLPMVLPAFHAVLDFPGNLTKFAIYRDPQDHKYYSLVNNITGSNIKQRNVLTLMVSDDLFHWRMHRGILNYEDNNYAEDASKVGFQYVDFIFDEEDIVFASRTAINDAYNFHNANYLTVHRIKNFRQ